MAIDRDKVIGWCDITSLHLSVFAHAGVLGIGGLAEFRENNKVAIALYEKIGFVKEGFHRNAVRIGTEYENQI